MDDSAMVGASAAPPEAPPPTKRLKGSDLGAADGGGASSVVGPMPDEGPQSIIAQFVSPQGEQLGPPLEVPLGTTPKQLEAIVNQLSTAEDPEAEKTPYAFFVDEVEVMDSLRSSVQQQELSTESTLQVVYQPQAVFRVRQVTRCTDTMPGHTEAILHVSFSPDGQTLASGGGDFTVRFWDVLTSTPKHTCRGHRNWVLCTAWSPDGKRFASGDRNGELRLWDPNTGKPVGKPMRGHKQHLTSISWQPLHRSADRSGRCVLFASSSKDRTVKIWNAATCRIVASLSAHADSVECVKWGGQGLMYTASRDRTVRVWAVDGDGAEGSSMGKLIRTLGGHAHRVNTLALNTDYVCRTGAFDHTGREITDAAEAKAAAQKRYQAVLPPQGEILVSGSDDFTLYLWTPATSKTPVARLTGHVQPVNHLSFSPDGRLLASASFDKKVKVWDGVTGKFRETLTGHVGRVYQVCWSADSRLLVSASADSTVKLWRGDRGTKSKALATLPGHADEVYALDWSPSGGRVASGSKDRTIKIWRH